MRSASVLIKGILISLILIMLMNIGIKLIIPAVHAGNHQIDLCEDGTTDPNTGKCIGDEGGDGAAEEDGDSAEEPPTYEERKKAMPPPKGPDISKTSTDIMEDVSRTATKAHRFFAPLINFSAFQIGNFLGNDYIYQGNMGKMLLSIWVVSRNIVNIAFVFILLWLALKTIFWPSGGMDELKKGLLKFTLLLVAVNFTWLGTRLVLDSASVATYVVFAIPSGISDPPAFEPCQINTSDGQPLKGVCYPTTIIAPADTGSEKVLYFEDTEGEDDDCAKVKDDYYGSGGAYLEDGSRNPDPEDGNEVYQGRTSICMENLNIFKYDQNTAVIYLTYGMARIQNLVSSTTGSDPTQLAVGVLMSIVIQVAYSIALLALLFALIIRMMFLWLLVAFSPFLVLFLWFGSGTDADPAGVGKYFSLKQFVNWAFVPAMVGAIFAVTFMMISAGQTMGDITLTAIDNLYEKSGFIFKLPGQKSLYAGMESLQSFIWLLISLAVLWFGVFAVLGKLSVIGSIFTSISDSGRKAAIQLGKLPFVAPITPYGSISENAKRLSPVHALDRVTEKYIGHSDSSTEKSKFGKTLQSVTFASDIKPMMINGIDPKEAEKIAKKYGFEKSKEGVTSMLKINSEDLIKGFKKSGANDIEARDLLRGLNSLDTPIASVESFSAKPPPASPAVPPAESPPKPPAE